MKNIIILLVFLLPVFLYGQTKKDLVVQDSLIGRAVTAADTADSGKRKAGNYATWELPAHSYGPSALAGLRAFARDTSRPWDMTEFKKINEAGEKTMVEFHLETAGTASDSFYVEQKNVIGYGTSASTSWTRVMVYQPEIKSDEDSVAVMNKWEYPETLSGRRCGDFTVYVPFNDIIRIRRRTPAYVTGNGVTFIRIRAKR